MSAYTLAVGTHDPVPVMATDDAGALREAASLAASRFAAELATTPQDVVTLMGPSGVLTAPNERLDAFAARRSRSEDVPVEGLAESPDCNGG